MLAVSSVATEMPLQDGTAKQSLAFNWSPLDERLLQLSLHCPTSRSIVRSMAVPYERSASYKHRTSQEAL